MRLLLVLFLIYRIYAIDSGDNAGALYGTWQGSLYRFSYPFLDPAVFRTQAIPTNITIVPSGNNSMTIIRSSAHVTGSRSVAPYSCPSGNICWCSLDCDYVENAVHDVINATIWDKNSYAGSITPFEFWPTKYFRKMGTLYIYFGTSPNSYSLDCISSSWGCSSTRGLMGIFTVHLVPSSIENACYDGYDLVNHDNITNNDPCYCQALQAHYSLSDVNMNIERNCSCGTPDEQYAPTRCHSNDPSDSPNHNGVIIGCSVAGGVLLLCAACCYCQKRGEKKEGADETLEAGLLPDK